MNMCAYASWRWNLPGHSKTKNFEAATVQVVLTFNVYSL